MAATFACTSTVAALCNAASANVQLDRYQNTSKAIGDHDTAQAHWHQFATFHVDDMLQHSHHMPQ
jgi:hypothetical protein